MLLLAAEIEQHNTTPSAVARDIGISKSQMSRILGGIRGMTVAELDAVCAVLGIAPSEILEAAEADDVALASEAG